MAARTRPRDEPLPYFAGKTAGERFAEEFAAAAAKPAPDYRIAHIYDEFLADDLGAKLLFWCVADPDADVGVSIEEAAEVACPIVWRLLGGDKERFAGWCREYLISPQSARRTNARPGVEGIEPARIKEILEADRARRLARSEPQPALLSEQREQRRRAPRHLDEG